MHHYTTNGTTCLVYIIPTIMLLHDVVGYVYTVVLSWMHVLLAALLYITVLHLVSCLV